MRTMGRLAEAALRRDEASETAPPVKKTKFPLGTTSVSEHNPDVPIAAAVAAPAMASASAVKRSAGFTPEGEHIPKMRAPAEARGEV